MPQSESARLVEVRLFCHEWNTGYELRGPPVLRRSADHLHFVEKENSPFTHAPARWWSKIQPSFTHASSKSQQPQSFSAVRQASLKTRFVGPGPQKYGSSPRERHCKDRGVVCQGLTLPSRGCPKGCAFCAPLMSNVRRQRNTWCRFPNARASVALCSVRACRPV
jgi:hypothetical protein